MQSKTSKSSETDFERALTLWRPHSSKKIEILNVRRNHQKRKENRSDSSNFSGGEATPAVTSAKVFTRPHQVRAHPSIGSLRLRKEDDESSAQYSVDERAQRIEQPQSSGMELNDFHERHSHKQRQPLVDENQDPEQQIIQTIQDPSVDPSSKYARRPRRKTREDRYDFKGDRSNKRSRDETGRQTVTKKKPRRKKSGAALNHDFQASNIDAERLTLKRPTGVAFLGKGKFSAAIAHRDLPDLIFPEMTFLSKSRNVSGLDKEAAKSQGKIGNVHGNHEISGYFAQAIDAISNDRQPPKISVHQTEPVGSEIPHYPAILATTKHHKHRPRSCSSISDHSKRRRTGKWTTHRPVAGVSQFYPPSSQQHVKNLNFAREAPISWSTSPPHHLKSVAHQPKGVIDDEVLPGENSKHVETKQQMNRPEVDHSDAGDPSDDDLMYQYTRKSLMELRQDLRRFASPGVLNQQEISLDDLKRMAARSEVYRGEDVDIQHDYTRDHRRNRVEVSSPDHIHSSPAPVHNDNDIDRSNAPNAFVTNDLPRGYTEWNEDHPAGFGEFECSQPRSPPCHDYDKQYSHSGGDDMQALPPRTIHDGRNVPHYPRLELLVPLGRPILQIETRPQQNLGLKSRHATRNSNRVSSLLSGFDRHNTDIDTKEALIYADYLSHHTPNSFSTLEDFAPASLDLSSPILNPSTRKQALFESTDTRSIIEQWQDSTSYKRAVIPTHEVSDTTHSFTQERAVSLDQNINTGTLHDEVLARDSRGWTGTSLQPMSPQMRPFVGLSRPYLLF